MDEITRTNDEVAIRVEALHKSFRLPRENHSGIKQALLNIFRRKRRKGYENQHVLKGIDFEINKGDFYGIVGRNGSGKSTLLKLLAGIYTPDKGSISVDGSLVPFIELGVGFNPELSGRDNVYLNGALLGFSRKQMDAMYEEIVEFAELGRFMDQKLKNYSSGMQVRLAFSIAIRAKSDILLLDEVLAVGDEAFQKKCNNYFAKIKKDGTKTVILVTHSMESVRRYCDRALLIDKGEIIISGNPNDVADEYSKQFIVNDQMSIKQGNRMGTGEVTYADVDFSIKEDVFMLDVTIENKTAEIQTGITMGFDFCINDDIITGIDTRYLDGYSQGITLEAGHKKKFTLSFANTFGNYGFTLNTNITTDLGINVTDHIRPALSFDSTNVRYSDAFKILAFPEVTEHDVKE